MLINNSMDEEDDNDIQITVDELPEEYQEAIIEDKTEKVSNFNENLAEKLDESQRKKIAITILEGIKADLESREKWAHGLAQGLKLLGLNVDVNIDDKLLSKVIDPLMLRAFLSFMSNRYEMYPASGISDYRIDGPSNEEIEKGSDKRIDWLNHYLYVTDTEYMNDCDRSDAYLCISGNGFKKIYRDPVTKLPLSRSIKPQDMILNNEAKSLKECTRKTQVEYLTKQTIEARVKEGFYIETAKKLSDEQEDNCYELSDNPIDIIIKDIYGFEDSYDKKTYFRYFESHVLLEEDFLLELEGEEGQGELPYIAHICAQNNELVGLYRGWIENAADYTAKECFVHRKFIPAFGLYALGYAHILANPAAALTTMDRMLFNAEQYAIYPAFVILEGRKIEHQDIALNPGEGMEVPSLGMPVRDVISHLPYKGASPIMKDLTTEWRNHWQAVDMGIESKLAEGGPNMPVGTTMALMEAQGKLHSMVIKSIIVSLGEELRMIDALFKESFSDEPFIAYTNGVKLEMSKSDYYDHVTIIPACSPDISSSVHRIMINDSIMRTMATNPSLYNQREVHKRFLESIKANDIDALLIPENKIIPLDPLSENANALQGKSLKAAEWQDHDSHIISHNAMMTSQEAQNSPMAIQILTEHVMTHMAMKYAVEMQQKLGMQLPPIEELQNPEIQNAIAQKLVPIMEERQKAQEQQKPLDPTAVMMADVQQRDEASKLKAEIDKMRIELEAYKAQLNFEQNKDKVEADLEIAEDRNETQLEIENIKHQGM